MTEFNRHRVRPSDITASMQPTKKQSAVSSNARYIGDAKRDTIVFTVRGEEDYTDVVPLNEVKGLEFPLLDDIRFDNGNVESAEDRPEALAKIVARDDWERERYFIKAGPDARLFNPVGLDEKQYHKRAGGELLKRYRQVNRKAFVSYIRFLQTKNLAFLYEAEREMA